MSAHSISLRLEVRDVYSGKPTYNADLGGGFQHNIVLSGGQGTVGQLLRDPTLYRTAEQLVAKGGTLVDKGITLVDNINQGKGTLGKLTTDEALHQRLNSAVGNLDRVLASLQNGDGTMGRLLHDPALFNSLNTTSVEVRELIADFRKNPKKFLTIQLKIF